MEGEGEGGYGESETARRRRAAKQSERSSERDGGYDEDSWVITFWHIGFPQGTDELNI